MDVEPVEILLVEDNPSDAELVLRALEKNHLANHVIHLLNGADAIDYLFCRGRYADRDSNHIPKLILLDLHLPKVGGLEVLEAIKADERSKMVPVIILTASDDDPDMEKAYLLGANSYLIKPLEFRQFSKIISELGLYWMVVGK